MGMQPLLLQTNKNTDEIHPREFDNFDHHLPILWIFYFVSSNPPKKLLKFCYVVSSLTIF